MSAGASGIQATVLQARQKLLYDALHIFTKGEMSPCFSASRLSTLKFTSLSGFPVTGYTDRRGPEAPAQGSLP